MNQQHTRSIVLDLVLTVFTFGLYNIWVNYKQIKSVNAMLGRDKYYFLHWILLCLITFGLYHIYHEYRKTVDIVTVMGNKESHEPIISVVLTAMALPWIADAIQQTHINRYYGSDSL